MRATKSELKLLVDSPDPPLQTAARDARDEQQMGAVGIKLTPQLAGEFFGGGGAVFGPLAGEEGLIVPKVGMPP